MSQWTETVIAEASAMWKAGLSASVIAVRYGVSRNAFLGLTHRHRDLFPPRRQASSRTHARTPVSRPSRAAVAVVTLPAEPMAGEPAVAAHDEGEAVAPDVKTLPWLKQPPQRFVSTPPVILGEIADGQCRFPLAAFDDPATADMPCCGGQAETGKPYCTGHMRIAYAPYERRVA